MKGQPDQRCNPIFSVLSRTESHTYILGASPDVKYEPEVETEVGGWRPQIITDCQRLNGRTLFGGDSKNDDHATNYRSLKAMTSTSKVMSTTPVHRSTAAVTFTNFNLMSTATRC